MLEKYNTEVLRLSYFDFVKIICINSLLYQYFMLLLNNIDAYAVCNTYYVICNH